MYYDWDQHDRPARRYSYVNDFDGRDVAELIRYARKLREEHEEDNR